MGVFRSALVLSCGLLIATAPALGADLGPGPGASYVTPVQADAWEFKFTPYGWFVGINGNVNAGATGLLRHRAL